MSDYNNTDQSEVAHPTHEAATGKPIIYVCHGKQCGRHAPYLMDRMSQVQAKGYAFVLEQATCMGQCPKGPNIKFKGEVIHHNTPISVSKMVKAKIPRKV